nr:hypothetical protein [Tanacetum cinerariifolium]
MLRRATYCLNYVNPSDSDSQLGDMLVARDSLWVPMLRRVVHTMMMVYNNSSSISSNIREQYLVPILTMLFSIHVDLILLLPLQKPSTRIKKWKIQRSTNEMPWLFIDTPTAMANLMTSVVERDDENATNPPLIPPTQQALHTLSTIKLPIMKKGVSTEDANQKFLRVFESNVKGSTASSSSTQNVAFVSSDSTSSTNEVSTAYGVSTSFGHNSQREGSSSYTDELMYSFFANQSSGPQLDHEDLKQLDEFDLEEMDLKWQVAMISMKLKKFYKKTGRKLYFVAKEPVGFDKKKLSALLSIIHSTLLERVLSYENEVLESVFDSRSSDVEDSPVNDSSVTVEEMHAVPPPMIGIYMPPKFDFGIDELKFTYGPKQSTNSESDTKTSDLAYCASNSSVETLEFMPKLVESKPKVVSKPKVWSDAPIIEEYESKSDDEYVFKATVEQEIPSCAFINTVKHVKSPRQTVKDQDTCSQNPKVDKRDWIGLMSKRLGLGYGYTRKACFLCGSFSHLIRDCDFHEKRIAKQVELSKSKNKDNPHQTIKAKRIVNSGCSRHMTENKAYLVEYKDFNGGLVAFEGSKGQLTGNSKMEAEHVQEYFVLPLWSFYTSTVKSSQAKNEDQKLNEDTGSKANKEPVDQDDQAFLEELERLKRQAKQVDEAAETLRKITPVNTASTPVNTTSTPVNTASPSRNVSATGPSYPDLLTYVNQDDYQIPSLEDIHEVPNDEIFTSASYDAEGAVDDFTNLNLLRGIIDKTLFIKKDKKDIMLAQVYMDDIIFGSTKKSWCDEFEALMKSRFQMSSMGELTFFLGLQVKQREDRIFISRDKYVAEILKKFDFMSVKTASTPIETKKPLVKDEKATDVDVTPKTSHLYAMKRIFRYLKGQPKLGIWYPRESTFNLEAYSDSKYAEANLDKKSTTEGGLVLLSFIKSNTGVVILKNLGRDIIEFCTSKGIKKEYSNARTPQQNRVVERKNKTLIEAVRTMLVDLFLPNTFWAEAVSTACYVLNRNKDNKTTGPKEANTSASTQDNINTGNSKMEAEHVQEYFVLPLWSSYTSTVKSSQAKNEDQKLNEDTEGAARASSTNYVNTASTPVNTASTPVNTTSTPVNTASPSRNVSATGPSYPDLLTYVNQDDYQIPSLEDIHEVPNDEIFTSASYDAEGAVDDFTNLNLLRGIIDKTLFIKKDKKDIMLAQVYMDDIIFGSTKKSWCDEFEALMKSRFQMSSMGELTFFLGLQVKQREDRIFISRDKYVAEILKKFDFMSVKTASTPIETKKPLVKDEKATDVDVTPKTSHLYAMKRIFRYLKGQPKLGIWYPRESTFNLEAYSDSKYAEANLDKKSTTEEAEYVAAANCCGQVLWIQNQMLNYGFIFMNTKIYIDNESII